jgi:pilus assembly protein Flp/PilA
MNQIAQSIRSFIVDEEGSQIVEYALIIALVSIFLVSLLATSGLGDEFDALATRVGLCFDSTDGTC